MTNIEGQLLRSAAYAVIYSLQLLIVVVVIICIPYLITKPHHEICVGLYAWLSLPLP